MQISIKIDISDSILNMPQNLEKKLPGMMRRIAMEGKSFWKSEAGRRLKSSRLAYQKGIEFEVTGTSEFVLKLEGFIPFVIEYGAKGFDMKPGFLKNAKMSKTGSRYRVIPLNVNRYVNMQKPRDFATVSDKSAPASWMHPGWQGRMISEKVLTEMVDVIIPKHVKETLGDL